VKAVYLFNFVKYVRWPGRQEAEPITICVAERNPFAGALQEALRGEEVEGRQLRARVIQAPDPKCEVVFVPKDTAEAPYLQSARKSPVLTVGETPGFLKQGGIINFIVEDGRVRFEIDAAAADRAELRISSHLMRLSRNPRTRG
jgi:hypothetical protein